MSNTEMIDNQSLQKLVDEFKSLHEIDQYKFFVATTEKRLTISQTIKEKFCLLSPEQKKQLIKELSDSI